MNTSEGLYCDLHIFGRAPLIYDSSAGSIILEVGERSFKSPFFSTPTMFINPPPKLPLLLRFPMPPTKPSSPEILLLDIEIYEAQLALYTTQVTQIRMANEQTMALYNDEIAIRRSERSKQESIKSTLGIQELGSHIRKRHLEDDTSDISAYKGEGDIVETNESNEKQVSELPNGEH